MRILLVEDDSMLAEALVIALKQAAYAVDWVKNGEAALLTLSTQNYQAILLDLGLPKQDGFSVLRQIRLQGLKLPILILTARDGLENRIQGLDLGADDYVIKPFHMQELLARLRASLRRQTGQVVPLLSVGRLQLNPSNFEACWQDTCQVLTAKEFALLQTLIRQPGRIFSRSELEDHLYGWNEEVESNAIDFLIHALRKKLNASVIKNVRGAGWLVPKENLT
ncbi:response regulator transcription factor [Thiomicrorhabdus arctica]|uniref:response regulator transcription factor n=1 Tax=Thiomicrorhabdus arctica TaxID=131540 RepID=UPI00035CE75A|nr:response regulator transcription factor [Thiomicrorhabdus arctica]